MISQALRLHESTIDRHLSDYALSEKLKRKHVGSQSRISSTQTMKLIEHLTEKPFFSHKMPKDAPHKLKPEEPQTLIEYYNDTLKPVLNAV
ncbi:hypothetical protein VPR01S_31_00150 [Vibrio proteolyticus NBRC 13287]|uniref:Uncharacterized protein n=1 Tax=Vibrio proteolyticus NBRC 13287 TaxID=1219065 RepID=U3BIM2_VIBPR|nr:hypothetical protein VPR01S_31_00150 [Vibrio proteolyticus NBRC 13287]